MQVVIIVLGRQSLPLAERIQAALPGVIRYGLATRIEATEVEVSFTEFGDTVRRLFTEGRPIIGICAAGILIRTLAPLLFDKRQEPPVLAVAEDGSAVVPLLGGLQGVNDLARQIGLALNVSPAITTTGDLRFRTALLAPPRGYELANPDDAKTFIANLLAGANVQLQGEAPWLSQSQLPFASENSSVADLMLQVTEQAVQPHANCLVYHPKTLAIGLDGASLNPADPEAAVILVNQTLSAANLARTAVAGVFATTADAGHPSIHAVAQSLKVPARFFPDASLDPATIALQATAGRGQLVVTHPIAIARAQFPFEAKAIGQAQGQLAIVGTGPGRADWMSPEVEALLTESTDWVGYTTYLNLVEPLRRGQQRHDSDNRVELERARLALDLAAQGRSVALVSSGDPGIYAMATAVFEVLEAEEANKPDWQQIAIRVAPGISALQAAASRIGAPIGHDFCAISLSDILKPWPMIAKRVAAVAEADFVIAFYNPVSKHRLWQLEQAKTILLQWRAPQTPVVLARDVGRPAESIRVITLADLTADQVDMRTLVLIGSSKTRLIPRSNGAQNPVWVYTPRHYNI